MTITSKNRMLFTFFFYVCYLKYFVLFIAATSISDFEININDIIKAKVYIMKNGAEPVTLLYSSKVYPNSQLEEGENLGFLETTSNKKGFFLTENNEKIQITSPCKGIVEQIFCNSGTVITAENIDGVASPKYILSLMCTELPTNSVFSLRKRKETENVTISVELSSRDNAIVSDLPDSEQVEEGATVLGMWFDDYTYVKYEALHRLNNVNTLYFKTQMIGQKFNRGLGLVKFEAEITPKMSEMGIDYQTQQIYTNTQNQNTEFQQMFQNDNTIIPQMIQDESNRAILSGNENIEQLNEDTNIDNNVKYYSNNEESIKNKDIQEDENEYDEEYISIKNALLNAAATYSLLNVNKLKKDKLDKIPHTFGIINPKNTRWIVKSPCSGILTTNILGDESNQIIEQGTLLATIKCDIQQKGSKDINKEQKHEELISPFSLKITSIKIKLRESENEINSDSESEFTNTMYAKVSKNEKILSGKLINESKHVPSYLIFGNYQLVTAPCEGKISIQKDIGNTVRIKEKIFKVKCKISHNDSSVENNIAYGRSTKNGLIAHYFKDHNSIVKTGEAVAIIRNNWKILTSPCDGLLVYTDTPGLSKKGSNIAIVICNDKKLKRRKIQATKSFVILATLLPNPSIVRKKQPLVIVDTSEFNWKSIEDNIEESDNEQYNEVKITKTILPLKQKGDETTGEIIQDVVSPCNGYLYKQSNHKSGSKIKEKKTVAIIKCENNKIYSFYAGKNLIILHNEVYKKDIETDNDSMENQNNSAEEIQVSKGEKLLVVLFIHNIKYHIIKAPCTGYGYTLTSKGKKIYKGKYFAVIQCKDEENTLTQKIRAIKDMKIVSSYISLKKKFSKGDPLFVTVE